MPVVFRTFAMEVHLFALKLGLLTFWGLWFSVVFLTNLFDGFRLLGIFPITWKVASQNFQPVAKATARYVSSVWLPACLFSGVIVWQLLAVTLLGWALMASLREGYIDGPAVNAAFACGLGLWAAFMIADEIFKQYDTQRSHVLFFTAQLLTLLAIHELPS